MLAHTVSSQDGSKTTTTVTAKSDGNGSSRAAAYSANGSSSATATTSSGQDPVDWDPAAAGGDWTDAKQPASTTATASVSAKDGECGKER